MAKRRVTKVMATVTVDGTVVSRKILGDRTLDMPLPKGRLAKSSFVFVKGASFLQLNNLEEPLFWQLGLARTEKSDAEAVAAELNAHGSRNSLALADGVPALPMEESPALGGELSPAAIDGMTEFGLQTPEDHEYFLSKFGDLVGILRVQRKENGAWKATLDKSNMPRVLRPETVAEGLMPPPGHSGLPKSLEAVVPTEYHYWKAQGDQARQMRDALVENGFFTDDCIKAVDGELRKVEVKYFLYQPGGDTAQKSFKAPTLADRVMNVIPDQLMAKAFTPMSDGEDWLEELDKNASDQALAILSSGDNATSPREMARAVGTVKGHYLLEHADTRMARAAFAPLGPCYKIAGEPSRIFCSSFPPATLRGVTLLKAASVKTIDVGGLPIYIDRPKGYVQTGKDENGNEWTREYKLDYGFLPRTKGGDGEELDIFVGPDANSDRVFWVTQNKADGTFDEYKVFVGFATPRDARDAYVAHIPEKFYAGMSETSLQQLKALAGVDPVQLAKRLAANAVSKVNGVSYDEVRRAVQAAVSEAYPPPEGMYCSGPYVVDLYDNDAVYESSDGTFKIGYTYNGGTATLNGQPQRVVRTYQAAGGTGAAPAPADPYGAQKAQWTGEYINNLPDSAFLYVESGGKKDDEGKTVPRSLRHFPVRDSGGKVDPEHVANALSRIPQSDVPDSVKEKAKAEAQRLLESTKKNLAQAVIKPFAGFEDFDACVAAQKAKGHSDESARKICGSLQADAEKAQKRMLRVAATKAGEEHYVLGIVLEPDVVDAQNDTYNADEVRKASERFMELHRNMGLMHKGFVNDKVQILENYIAPADFSIGDTLVKKGTWLMGVRVQDPQLWQAVKSGDLTGFSIGGSAIRTPTSQEV